jgi:hypothetical protein
MDQQTTQRPSFWLLADNSVSLGGDKDVRCGGRVVRRPRELDVSVLAGHSKDLGFETVSTRQQDHAPLLRFLMLVTAGSAEGSWFPLRLPVKGKSNAGWRRSAACLARFLFAVLCSGADDSCARLRFRAAIKSITGDGVDTPAA